MKLVAKWLQIMCWLVLVQGACTEFAYARGDDSKFKIPSSKEAAVLFEEVQHIILPQLSERDSLYYNRFAEKIKYDRILPNRIL